MARTILACIVVSLVVGCGGGDGNSNSNSSADALTTMNRAPLLMPIPDASNSPYSYSTRVRTSVSDPDGDFVDLMVAVSNGSVVRAYSDSVGGEIVLEPLQLGSSEIVVTAHDGKASATQRFVYEVGEVTKVAELSAIPGEGGAVSLRNSSDEVVDFVLSHNGFRTFQNIDEIVEYVHAMPAEFSGESFPRRLWRFVRDNVYHWPFLNSGTWLMNPLVQINSIGWGFCSSVAAMYVELARAAGYEARIWAIGGHVVPEVRMATGWAMFDPDLAVYYYTASGQVAGVEELEADPSLVSAPIQSLFATGQYDYPYTTAIAKLYGTQDDNAIWSNLLPTVAGQSGRIFLPPGARLTYQGKWTEPPVGLDDFGQPFEVPEFRQAALTLAGGWTGTVALPWVAWDVLGDGEVELGEARFPVDSDALRQALRSATYPIHEMQIVESTGEIQIVFLINPTRYEVVDQSIVELTGQNVWRVQVTTESLPLAVRPGTPLASERRKPVPLNL